MVSELRAPQTDEEWRVYHDIRERVLWTARGRIGYDRNHPDEHVPGHYPFLYVTDGTPLGVVRVDIDGDTATFRRVAILETEQRRGHGRQLLLLAEAFVRSQGAALIRSSVDVSALGFYEKAGYKGARIPGPDGTVAMEKHLAA